MNADENQADVFRFAPELFAIRTKVLMRLDESGYQWLSHFSAVDPLHDVYGIEVCGIVDRDDAVQIHRLMMKMFPTWLPG